MTLPLTRNIIYNGAGTIDMEIDHSVYGWIPFTANPNDSEELGCALYAAAIAGELGAIAPYVPPSPPPSGAGFEQAIKTGVGGIVAANALARAYPLFFAAVQSGQWADVQALILDAQTTGAITPTQYAEFQAAATSFNIPVTLP